MPTPIYTFYNVHKIIVSYIPEGKIRKKKVTYTVVGEVKQYETLFSFRDDENINRYLGFSDEIEITFVFKKQLNPSFAK